MKQVPTSDNNDHTSTKVKMEGRVITIAHTYELDVQMQKKGFLYDIIGTGYRRSTKYDKDSCDSSVSSGSY
jgi:hypothetical protein